MDLADIGRLIGMFDASDLTALRLDLEDAHLELEKQALPPAGTCLSAPPASESALASTPVGASVAEPAEKAAAQDAMHLRAPLVGLFYRASSPEAEPFVEEGQHVEKGQVLCIIEAMKVMNEVESPISGTVRAIFPTNGAMVAYDQTLMDIVG